MTDTETLRAVDKVAGYIVHRLEYPRLRTPPPGWKDSAGLKIALPTGKRDYRRFIANLEKGAPLNLTVEDKQRLGFKDRRLSPGDCEEVRGAVSLVFCGAILDGWENNRPAYRAGPELWNKKLGLADWKNLFRAARHALRFDAKDGNGPRSRVCSLNALEDFSRTVDFHAGLCAGKSACDLDSEDYAGSASDYLARRALEVSHRAEVKTANRTRLAGIARDFHRAILHARLASEKAGKRARREWLANLKTLRLATGAVAGSGHGLSMKRKDGKGARSLHSKIASFSEYLCAGLLAEANTERAGDLLRAFQDAVSIGLTATAHC